ENRLKSLFSLHVFDHHVTEAGAGHLGRTFHQTGKVIRNFARGDGFFHAGDDQISSFCPTHVTQHHFSRQDQRTWVHVVFASVLGSRTVGSFEHGSGVGQVGARSDTNATHLCSQRVGDVVA